MRGNVWRVAKAALAAAALCCALAFSAPAHADCTPPPAPEPITSETAISPTFSSPELDTIVGATDRDRVGRVVAPVYVNGEGPFRFIVDTGANRSVLSMRLANRLGLIPNGAGDVHSVNGVATAPFVDVASLNYGALSIENTQLPVLEGGVFAGEWGLLGVDGMSGRRLRMNIRDNCIEIVNARRAPRLRGWETVRGELRFGHLLVADAYVRDVRIKVLIDTGSDATLGNIALRDALRTARNRRTDVTSYTAGDLLVLERAIVVPRLRIDSVEISNVAAYVGDFHIFRLWELDDEPTLLIGMDVISRAREVAIDYERGLLHFRLDGPISGNRSYTPR